MNLPDFFTEISIFRAIITKGGFMKKSVIRIFFVTVFFICAAFCFGEDSKNTELSVDEARGLYSLLENIKSQKSLFPEEVSAANLKNLLKEDYAKGAVLYDDKPYLLNIHNCIFVSVRKNNLLSFITYVSSDPSLSADECIKIANDWNSESSFATVSFCEGEFWIQYFMSFNWGIHADNFNDTIEWILSTSYYFENQLKDIVKQKE